MHLITGKGKADHISSADDGLIHSLVNGAGRSVLSGCEATVVSANSVSVSGGLVLMDGRFATVDADGESVAIANGTQGQKRNDIVGIRYAVDSEGFESTALEVLRGTPGATAADPTYTAGNIIDGSTSAFMPLWRITLDGLSVGTPVALYSKNVSQGSTGSVVFRRDDASPAATYGGEWERIADTFMFLRLRVWVRVS